MHERPLLMTPENIRKILSVSLKLKHQIIQSQTLQYHRFYDTAIFIFNYHLP